jgi:glycosyltransferase involved in cell wall biosynthesis
MATVQQEDGYMSGRKLVYVLDRFPADTLNFVYNEIEVLDRAGFDISIYSLLPCEFCPAGAEAFRERTVPVKPVSAGRLMKSLLYYLVRSPLTLLALLVTLPFDNRDGFAGKFPRTISHVVFGVHFAWLQRKSKVHVHAHFALKAATAAYCAAKLNGSTFSFTAHGSATIHPPSRYSLPSKVRGAAFIIAVSQYNKRMIMELCPDYPADRIIVNRTGIVVEDFPFAPPARSLGETFRILCVASLYPIKNHEALIDACSHLEQQGLDFRLTLVGKDEGGRREFLENRAAARGIAGKIDFHGLADHGEVSGLLARADLFVLTSHSEGIPVAMMEAMATGIPVLGPRVTGLPELVEENVSGWLAAPDKPREFAGVMAGLIVDPDRGEAVRVTARKKIEEEFDMKANAEKLAGIFGEMLPNQS